MFILKTRSEVKVTVTRKWYATLFHPKMHQHIKFEIPTSKNIGYINRTRSGTDGLTDGRTDIVIAIKTRSEVKVKVTVTRKCYVTLLNPKMHSHTKEYRRYAPNTKRDGRTVRLLYASQSSFGGIKIIRIEPPLAKLSANVHGRVVFLYVLL